MDSNRKRLISYHKFSFLQHYTDLEIVKGIKAKKEFAFDYFYKKYAPAFYGEIKRTLPAEAKADEVLTICFQHMWMHIDEFTFQQSLYSWALRIVHQQTFKQKLDTALYEMFYCQLNEPASPRHLQAV